jgi:hypothetical protein
MNFDRHSTAERGLDGLDDGADLGLDVAVGALDLGRKGPVVLARAAVGAARGQGAEQRVPPPRQLPRARRRVRRRIGPRREPLPRSRARVGRRGQLRCGRGH